MWTREQVDAALANYFGPGNLLRQLALLWVADRVDEALQEYRSQHGIGGVWETRERIVVALTGGSEGDTLIRRAARIAARSAGGDLLAVHVARSDGLAAGVSHASLARQRRLVEDLGGSYHSIVVDDVATALVEFARVAAGLVVPLLVAQALVPFRTDRSTPMPRSSWSWRSSRSPCLGRRQRVRRHRDGGPAAGSRHRGVPTGHACTQVGGHQYHGSSA